MAGGSSVIVCAFTILLALSCDADRLLHRQRTFESTMMQDITMLSSQVLKIQENMETLTQMVNASLQTNGQAPGGSYTVVQDIDRKLSRTTRQLHAAFAKQKMAISKELARMDETISSTQEEHREQLEGIQKKGMTSEKRMQKIEKKILGKLDNYTKVVGEHLANVTEGYANTIETQMDVVLLQIHNHTVSVGTKLQCTATATTLNRTLQLVKQITSQSETIDKRVTDIEFFLWQTTSKLSLAVKHPCPIHIRLVGGSSRSSGRIEIWHDDQWGTVCNDLFDENDNGATVVCRMLGYTRGVLSMSYGVGDGPIWLDEVRCTVEENCILDCSRNDFGEHDCYHNEDVGVDCYD